MSADMWIYGIDVSAAAKTAGHGTWIARGFARNGVLAIDRCEPASEWLRVRPARAECFPALVAFIAGQPKAAFGLDFPFGIPRVYVQQDTWLNFVRWFSETFRTAQEFRDYSRSVTPNSEPKRAVDRVARTPFAPCNLRLYPLTYHGIADILAPLIEANAARVLPMQQMVADKPVVLEICPASTLRCLGAPSTGYKGASDACRRMRAQIMSWLERRPDLPTVSVQDSALRERILDDAQGDALDSLIAADATWRAMRAAQPLAEDNLEGHVFV